MDGGLERSERSQNVHKTCFAFWVCEGTEGTFVPPMSDFDGLRSCYETQTAGLGIPFCFVGASSYNVFLVAGSVRIPEELSSRVKC